MTALPSGVRIRPATPDDAAAGSALHRACWQEAYGPHADPDLTAADELYARGVC